MKKIIMAAMVLSMFAPVSFAADVARENAKQVIEMKDGSTLYVFKDNKMAMEDKHGRAVRMKKGHVMETKDGQKIMMYGDEVMRLDSLLRQGHE